MNLINRLMDWGHRRVESSGSEPEFIPLRRDEILTLQSDMPTKPLRETAQDWRQALGMNLFETPFAEEMRCRQVELERVPFITEFEISELALAVSDRAWLDDATQFQKHRLETLVCSDTTRIEMRFEWDIWARWKRALRLTRWFPIRTRTVTIDGRVLYPYLKVSLPNNRHHVKFAIRD
jgi:hypothetical protein